MESNHNIVCKFSIFEEFFLCLVFDGQLSFSINLMQIIDDDSGMRMRPMPGMLEFKTSGTMVFKEKLSNVFEKNISRTGSVYSCT